MKRQTQTALIALGSGVTVLAVVVAVILWVTNDMRWMLVLGSAGLFGAAVWLGGRRGGGMFGLLFLCLPLFLLHAALVVPELPGIWPHLVFWPAFALVGWLGFRSPGRPSLATVAALCVLVSLGGWYGWAYVPGAITRSLNQERNDPAPEYALTTLEGAPYPSTSLDGKVVVLDFFATWCLPCIAELPEIDAIHRRYAAARDVEVLVVANDSGGDTPEAIQAFVAKRDLEVPFAYDPGGKAHKAFGFAGLPGLAVIDSNGRIRFAREGFNAAENDFQENLTELIERLRTAEPGDVGAI